MFFPKKRKKNKKKKKSNKKYFLVYGFINRYNRFINYQLLNLLLFVAIPPFLCRYALFYNILFRKVYAYIQIICDITFFFYCMRFGTIFIGRFIVFCYEIRVYSFLMFFLYVVILSGVISRNLDSGSHIIWLLLFE